MSEDNDDAWEHVRRLFALLRKDPEMRQEQARARHPISDGPTLSVVVFPGGLYARHNIAPGHPLLDTAAAAARVLEDYLREPFLHEASQHGYAVAFESLLAVVACFARCPELDGFNLDVQHLSASGYH